MGLYGNKFIDNYYQSLYEFDYLLIESLSINESSIDIKNIKESIKNIISKLIKGFTGFVITAVSNLVKFINDLYDKINIKDSTIKKMVKNISFEDLEKAKSNGWKGISIKYPMIKLLTFSNSRLMMEVESIEWKYITDDFMDDDANHITKLKACKETNDIEKAREIYNRILNGDNSTEGLLYKMNNIKKLSPKDSISEIDNYNNTELDLNSYIFYTNKISYKDDNGEEYYYPDKDGFNNVKDMVFNSQKYIKQYKKNGNNSIKDVKEEYNSIQKEISNINSSSNNTEIDEMILDIRLKMTHYKIKAYTIGIKETIGAIKLQHKYALKTYAQCLSSIKKYNNP